MRERLIVSQEKVLNQKKTLHTIWLTFNKYIRGAARYTILLYLKVV